MRFRSVLAVAVLLWSTSTAFVPHTVRWKQMPHSTSHPTKTRGIASKDSVPVRSSSPLLMSSWSSDYNNDDASKMLQLRTDLRIFLTQRAVQSFMFLLITCRDPHTVKWLEKNYGFTNLHNYHGTGALNVTEYPSWSSLLVDMVSKPKDMVVVRAKRRGRGQGGWSKKNPYLPERFVEFEIDIDPPSLVSRLVSVREQIAKEWIVDLDTFKDFNERILESYHEQLLSRRNMEETSSGKNEEEDDDGDETAGNEVNAREDAGIDSGEQLTAPYSSSGLKNKPDAVFDRNSMVLLEYTMESNDRESSPHRRGNFDLLILLSTQESVHRILREYREAGAERQVSFEWLRDFYVDCVEDFFDGDQPYGRADDFLEELLKTSPSMKQVDNKVELVDPLRITEDIIRMRSVVADEWKDIVTRTPEEHMDVRKLLLARQMGLFSPDNDEQQQQEHETGVETGISDQHGDAGFE